MIFQCTELKMVIFPVIINTDGVTHMGRRIPYSGVILDKEKKVP